MKKFTKALKSNITSVNGSPSVEKSKLKNQSTDSSGCPHIEGLLLKKNAHGEWKKRHGTLKDTFFITNKPKHKKPTSEIKEKIDLRDVASVGEFDGILEIEMGNGETLSFMYDEKDASGSDINAWYDALNKRHAWAKTQPGGAGTRLRAVSGDDAGDSNIFGEHRIHISGYLQKKSHNKYNGMQERFVKLEGKNLCYYKKKNDDTPLGTVSMDTADFVRAYDATPDCAIFEVQDEDADRVFVFQTPSHADMLRWITVINKVLQAYKERKQLAIEAKIAEETPMRVRMYDEMGEKDFLTQVECDLAELYPTMEMQAGMSLKEHLLCAEEVLAYLMDVVPEVQCVGVDRACRYDILAAVMTEVNTTLTERLSALVLPTVLSNGTEQREDLYEHASLGDLHQLIDWIARYQVTLKSIKCPVSTTTGTTTVVAGGAYLSATCRTPKASGVFGLMPGICKLYVHGGSAGAKGGAAHHLYDHCMKVWDSVVANPEEMIQQHSNGSFYTHAPIDMWEAINQHVALATATNSPILHVLIAEKVVTSLSDVFNTIITYVQTLDTSENPALQEIELEYISALANDTALHIEEVIELIDTFTISEIRERIDEIFDPLTTLLVQCGQACLKRLAAKVMSDVQDTLDEVFMPDWLEGNQVHIVTTTISDYMNDFERFLVEFWAAKFSYTILEAVILSYIRVILFKKGVSTPMPASPNTPEAAPKVGFFSSLMRKTQELSQKITQSGPYQCAVDEESLGRLAQDVNTLNAFFSKKAGQDVATEFLAIINEISLMLFLDGVALVQHAAKRAMEFPSAAPAIKITALAIMRMRPDTIMRPHLDMLHVTLDPLIASATERLKVQEAQDIAEDRLSLLYSDLIPPALLQKPAVAPSLARRLKTMSHVNLGATANHKITRQSSGDEEEDEDSDADSVSDGRLSGSGRGSLSARNRAISGGEGSRKGDLMDDIIDVLNTHDQEDAAYLQAQEEERQREEALRKKVGVLAYEGHMEKKSPAHNQWQRRWFKLVTRETLNPELPYIYTFNWYKAEGQKVSNSLTVDQLKCISVLSSCRALSYLPIQQTLMLTSEALNQPLAMVVKTHDPESTKQPNQPVGGDKEQWVTICIQQTDGKDHVLRGAKVDRVIKWINLLSLAASLGYDEHDHTWNRAAFERNKEAAADYAAQHPFIPASTSSNNLVKSQSSGKMGSQDSPQAAHKGLPPPGPGKSAGLDPEEAAAAIKAIKLDDHKREADERALAAKRREEERRAAEEEDRLEDERQLIAERELLALKAATAKKKADREAAARLAAERAEQEAREELQLQQQREEAARLEKDELDREERERQKRTLVRRQSNPESAEDSPVSSPGGGGGRGTNPILQKDGKAREVLNPLKRTSSVRRVPPPPPPTSSGDTSTPLVSVESAPEVAQPVLETPIAVSKPPTKVIRMVGKRRASQQKSAHNTAAASASESGSNTSHTDRRSFDHDDEEEDSSPGASDDDSNSDNESDKDKNQARTNDTGKIPSPSPSPSPAASPLGRSALRKSSLSGQGMLDSPQSLTTDSPSASGGRKSLSRGVSFANNVREPARTSESDPIVAPMVNPRPIPAAPIAPTTTPTTTPTTASRAPFSATPATTTTDDQDGDQEDDDTSENVATEQELSQLARKQGVVSGKLYRRSVVVQKKPTVETPPEKEGYMMKKSPAMFAGWQKRYFLTNSNGDIEYYKTEADAHNGTVQPQGVIMVKYIKVDRGVEVDDKSSELSINIGSKTVHLRASDRAEARAWMSNITQWMIHSA